MDKDIKNEILEGAEEQASADMASAVSTDAPDAVAATDAQEASVPDVAPVPTVKSGSVLRDVLPVFIGELIVSLLTVGVFLIVQAIFKDTPIYDYTVITGVLLGSLVIIANYLLLSVSVGRVIDKIIDLRGNTEMDEEAAAAFANENALKIQTAVTKSYILRTLSMVVALVVALLTPVFNVIAMVVPLVMFKPILYCAEFIKVKMGKKV